MSVESVSIFKNEIDAAHELFRRTQILLDFLGEPWLVRYSIVDTKSKRTSFDYVRRAAAAAHPSTEEKPANLAGETGNGRDPGRRGSGARLVLGKVCESNARRRVIGWVRATKAVVNERSFVGIERATRRIASKRTYLLGKSNTYRLVRHVRYYSLLAFFGARRRIYARVPRGRPPP